MLCVAKYGLSNRNSIDFDDRYWRIIAILDGVGYTEKEKHMGFSGKGSICAKKKKQQVLSIRWYL